MLASENPIPQALIDRPQWIIWKNVNGRKIPFRVDGRPASSTDPETWTAYDTARRAAAGIPQGEGGLGFVFTADDPFIGIDLDGCVDASGKVEDWAVEILINVESYCEISPSKTGVKIFAIGSLPDGRGRKAAVPGVDTVSAKVPSIEIYDRGRYFAVTGEACWWKGTLSDSQVAVDKILEKHFPAAKAPAVATNIPRPSADREAVIERARLYMMTVDPAISGSGGHNTTFRAACALVIGFGLDPETAYPLLAEWNERCAPPWSERELIHKIESADKVGGDRGYLLGEQSDAAQAAEWLGRISATWFGSSSVEVNDQTVDAINAGIHAAPAQAEAEIEELLAPVPKSPIFPDECLRPPGFLGEVIDWNLDTALYPLPRLALAGSLALMSVLTGSKITDRYGTRTNVYTLGLAPTGAGKEHSRKVNKSILRAAGGGDMLGPERIGSSAGLVNWIAKHGATLFQLDEIGRLFQTMKSASKSPHLFNIASVLMSMYSSSDQEWIGDAYADEEKTPRIDQPHAVVYGSTTPGDFFGSLTADNVTDGFLGRFLAFEDGRSEFNEERDIDTAVPTHIVAGAQEWIEKQVRRGNLAGIVTRPIMVDHSPEAVERFNIHLRAITARQAHDEETHGALWARSGGKAGKLALLFAASRCTGATSISVELRDVDLAIKLSNYLTRRMIYNVFEMVAENEIVAKKKRILREIGDRPLTGSALSRKTQFLGRRERDELLSDLVACGLVRVETTSTGGRPRTTFRRVTASPEA